MGILFFALWLLLNGYFALDIKMLEIVGFGALFSVLLYLFMIRFTRFTWKIDLFFTLHFHWFLAYFAVLLWEILLSNIKVIGLILKVKVNPSPCIVQIQVPIKNEMLRSVLANSITLTPGTITVACTAEHYTVHCLQREYIEGIEQSALVRILMKLEEKIQ